MDAEAAALDAAGALAAIRALAGVDDPEARAALVACLDGEPATAAAASASLGAGGAAALPVCVAALRHAGRARWAALAIARIGPDARAVAALWRALVGAPPPTRVAVTAALVCSAHPLPAALGVRLCTDDDDGVQLMLLDGLGRCAPGTVDAATVERMLGLARTAVPPTVRALATWAGAAHALDEAIPIAVDHFADPLARAALVACVQRRGGPLRVLVEAWPVMPGLDPTGELLEELGRGRGGRDAG